MRMCPVGAWGRVWGLMRWRRGIRGGGGRRLRGSIREEGRGEEVGRAAGERIDGVCELVGFHRTEQS